MAWPDEVRDQEAPDLSVKLTKREKDLASALVDQMSGDFDPAALEDGYQSERRTRIDAKREAGDTADAAQAFGEEGEGAGGGKVVDLMDALERSINKRGAKGQKSGQKSGAKRRKSS